MDRQKYRIYNTSRWHGCIKRWKASLTVLIFRSSWLLGTSIPIVLLEKPWWSRSHRWTYGGRGIVQCPKDSRHNQCVNLWMDGIFHRKYPTRWDGIYFIYFNWMGSIHPKVPFQQTHSNKHFNFSSFTIFALPVMNGNIKTVTLQ